MTCFSKLYLSGGDVIDCNLLNILFLIVKVIRTNLMV